jgi:hypothetical protein
MSPDGLRAVARNLFESSKVGDDRTLGEKAIGMLAFQQLGGRCDIVSRADGSAETWVLRLARGSATAQLERERRRARAEPGTTVYLADLDPDVLRLLTTRKLVDYLRTRRSAALARVDYVIEVVEGRSGELVTPDKPDGIKLDIPAHPTLWGRIEFGLYVASHDGRRRRVAVVGRGGTNIIDDLAELDEFSAPPWKSDQVSGQIIFEALQQSAGSPRGRPTRCAGFSAAVEEDRLAPAYRLLAATGMRRGEALGLRWANVDLDAARIVVNRSLTVVNDEMVWASPRTSRSRRSLSLDADTVVVLRAHRRRQLEERLNAGELWQDNDLVFCNEMGKSLHPDRFTRAFTAATRRAGVRAIRLHGLRHTWATLALQAGIHPKVVSERLGHATRSERDIAWWASRTGPLTRAPGTNQRALSELESRSLKACVAP